MQSFIDEIIDGRRLRYNDAYDELYEYSYPHGCFLFVGKLRGRSIKEFFGEDEE